MSDTEREVLEESLKGYKEKVSPIDKATLTWDRDLIFVGRTGQGYEIEFDAQVQWGCKPTDALLLSLAGCMGIDVVSFLKKMRAEIAGFRITMTGERNPTPPQYYKAVEMTLHIAGKNLDPKKVERAVSLSHEKYCSVYNSLRKDIDVKVNYVLEEKEPEEGAPGK
ncbi:MAG: OsmC family protein [Alphaproteobacteria bacterium]|uniref:OsmC family protein n=1 Tax=Candidatus Nitrobium versatile TaxID=2884831 RepID=A0A953JC46_9BACT|nr:OsmC family protein [Candidatus Nitrobium versatile]